MAANSNQLRTGIDRALKRLFDLLAASVLIILSSPLIAAVALAIKVDSRGTVFYRCRRVGFRGQELLMLKFRKMHADAAGLALTIGDDARFTRVGRFLSRSKIDEIPQLWNVFRGEMSLIGPRPEDPSFVDLRANDFAAILSVKPGITGLSQLAFAKESELLDPDDGVRDYLERFLPQKIALDRFYVSRRTLWFDLEILAWTVAAVLFRRDVAVNRTTGTLTARSPRGSNELGTVPVMR